MKLIIFTLSVFLLIFIPVLYFFYPSGIMGPSDYIGNDNISFKFNKEYRPLDQELYSNSKILLSNISELKNIVNIRSTQNNNTTIPPIGNSLLFYENNFFIGLKQGLIIKLNQDFKNPELLLDISGQAVLNEEADQEEGLNGFNFIKNENGGYLLLVNYVDRNKNKVLSSFIVQDNFSKIDNSKEDKLLVYKNLEIDPFYLGHNCGTINIVSNEEIFSCVGDKIGLELIDVNPDILSKYFSDKFHSLIFKVDLKSKNKILKKDYENIIYIKENIGIEIISRGLRNPWNFHIDEDGLNAIVGDVGEYDWEEVNILNNKSLYSKHFEYPYYEGKNKNNIPIPEEYKKNFFHPQHIYHHRESNLSDFNREGCAIINGRNFLNKNKSRVYFYTDYCSFFINKIEISDLTHKIKVGKFFDLREDKNLSKDKLKELHIYKHDLYILKDSIFILGHINENYALFKMKLLNY